MKRKTIYILILAALLAASIWQLSTAKDPIPIDMTYREAVTVGSISDWAFTRVVYDTSYYWAFFKHDTSGELSQGIPGDTMGNNWQTFVSHQSSERPMYLLMPGMAYSEAVTIITRESGWRMNRTTDPFSLYWSVHEYDKGTLTEEIPADTTGDNWRNIK